MYDAEVAEGAKYLDGVKPNWFLADHVKVSVLNQMQYETCVLGQLYGAHTSKNLSADTAFAVPKGFVLSADPRKTQKSLFGLRTEIVVDDTEKERLYRLLSSSWTQEILRRRGEYGFDRASEKAAADKAAAEKKAPSKKTTKRKR